MQAGVRKGKPYSFNYSVQDERTGVLHSRDEARDETGHVKGNYEVGTSYLYNLFFRKYVFSIIFRILYIF